MWLCCLKAKQANSKFSGIIFRHVLSSAPPPQLFQVSPPSGPGASPGTGSSPKAVASPSAQRMNFPNAFFQAPRQLWEPKQSKPEGLGRLTTEVLRFRCLISISMGHTTPHHITATPGTPLLGAARLWQELALIASTPELRGSLEPAAAGSR